MTLLSFVSKTKKGKPSAFHSTTESTTLAGIVPQQDAMLICSADK